MLTSCSESIPLSNYPDVYIGEIKAEPLTGKIVRIPKENLDLETQEGKAKAKNLIVNLTVSDRRNARGYNNLKKYHEQLKKLYNKPTKKQSTPSS